MRSGLFAGFFAAAMLASAGDVAPQMLDISQKAAKPGDVITVMGMGLSTKNVDEVYLTDHRFDMRVKVIEQKDTSVTFRVPPFAKPGRMQLLFLTKGDAPKLLEQPVYLLIDDPEAEVLTAKTPAPASGAPAADSPSAAAASSPAAPQESAKSDETKADTRSADSSKSDAAKDQGAKPEAKVDSGNQAKLDSARLITAKPK